MYLMSPHILILIILFFIIIFLFYKTLIRNNSFSWIKIIKNIKKDYWHKGMCLWFIIGILSIGIWFSEPYIPSNTPKKTLVLLDMSYSMTANDVGATRIDLARIFMETLQKSVKNLDILLFTQDVFDAWNDISIIQEKNIVKLNQISQWTASSDALLLAITHKNYNNILLISDGEINKWMDIKDTISYLKNKKTPISTLSIGTASVQVIDLITPFGNTIKKEITPVDGITLKKISLETQGIYQHIEKIENIQEVSKIFQSYFNKIKHKKDVSFYFLITGFILLCLSLLVLFIFRKQ